MSFRFTVDACPKCQEQPDGSIEVLQGCASIAQSETPGVWDHEGYTRMFWDSQVPLEDSSKPGQCLLQCSAGDEEWWTPFEAVQDSPWPAPPGSAA